MSVYRRFFRIKHQGLLEAISIYLNARSTYMDHIWAIQKEIGAQNTSFYHQGGHIHGFQFSESPEPLLYKSVGNGIYLPKKNSSQAKALWKRINAIRGPGDINDCVLPVVGLTRFGLVDGFRMHINYVHGGEKSGWFLSVSWREASKEELDDYLAEKNAGTRFCAALDHLLWIPPEGLEEVKGWEVDKAIDEAGEAAED